MTLCAEHACGKRGHVRREVYSGTMSSPSLPALPSPSSTSAHVIVHHQQHVNRSVVDVDLDATTAAAAAAAAAAATSGVDPLAPLVPAIVCVILVTVIFMSIAGNLLVCIAIATDRNLRKLSNLFLVSLAVADLFVATLVMTFALANDMIGHWIFGEGFCNVWIAFDVMGSTSSILNLCAISLDRYLHIRDPLRYSRWMTKSVVLAFIAAIWLTSCLVSFLPISQGLHLPPDTTNRTVVGPPSCAMDLSPTYAVVSSSISFFLPCCVMVAFYTRLYMYARMHVKNIKAMTRPVPLTYEDEDHRPLSASPGPSAGGASRLNSHGSQAGTGSGSGGGGGGGSQHVSEHKAAVTLGIIMGTFLICWVPFFIINITAAFCKTCISGLCFKVLTWLGYANSALNPIIYSIFNQEFRRAFGRTLTLYGHKCFCLCHYCRSDRDEFCSNGKSAYHHQHHPPNRHRHQHDQSLKTSSTLMAKDDSLPKEVRRSSKRDHAQSNGKHVITDGQHANSFGLKDSSM